MTVPFKPRSTYRIQFHPAFDFDAAAKIAPYLAQLGVGQLYASPYLQAVPGSTHGYDVVDHSRLNPELGGEAGHERLCAALARAGLGQLLDIVPNHMAAVGKVNRFWWDVLENGPASRYADYFDIDWESYSDREHPTVLVAVLGDHYGRVLEREEIQIAFDSGQFSVRYYEHELPLAPPSLAAILGPAAARVQSREAGELAEAFGALASGSMGEPPEVGWRRYRKSDELFQQLAQLYEHDPGFAEALRQELDALNADVDRLDALLRRQNYRLAYWKTAREELDYRRFFNIETLIGLRVEDPHVFEDTHRLILGLVQAGAVQGLRIDHVDGLRDPLGYLRRLRQQAGDAYIVVEKILALDEDLPESWPIAGTSGYDFLTRVNNLFVDRTNEAAFSGVYEAFTGQCEPFSELAYAAKRQMMDTELRAEVDMLTRRLSAICDQIRRHRDHTRSELRAALVCLLATMPVYRTYVRVGEPARPEDKAYLRATLEHAAQRCPEVDPELWALLFELVTMERQDPEATAFAARLAQVSGAVMAKGVEDTAFYRYNRLVSLNEVGGEPGLFGRPAQAFHDDMLRTAQTWPDTLLTLSTHDTKRSADVRARLNVLSELPDAFQGLLAEISQLTASYRPEAFLDRNTEYLLYQTLLGAFPIDVERLLAFLLKAARESKVHTSWINPAADYERALQDYAAALLTDDAFLACLKGFMSEHRLCERGRLNSLAQTTLLLTCPGVPDVYQGDELWDLSLVDPDNRRPVDFELRSRLLHELGATPPSVTLAEDELGLHKMWLISRILQHRQRQPACYDRAPYQPLFAQGDKARHLVAFGRERLWVLVPRLVVGLASGWGDTSIEVPSGDYRHLLSGQRFSGGRLALASLMEQFPVCVLVEEPS